MGFCQNIIKIQSINNFLQIFTSDDKQKSCNSCKLVEENKKAAKKAKAPPTMKACSQNRKGCLKFIPENGPKTYAVCLAAKTEGS
jgi:hypothetical protein